MKIIARMLSPVIVAAWLLVGASAASAAAVVKTQPPCSGPCLVFGPADAIPPARSIVFVAPSKGTAIVTFHGTLQCSSNNVSLTNFDLSTQIVEGNEVANAAGPGGMNFFFSLEPYDGNSRTTAINLASTRVFAIAAAGTKVYRFRVTRGFVATSAGCAVYNGVLTVNFIP